MAASTCCASSFHQRARALWRDESALIQLRSRRSRGNADSVIWAFCWLKPLKLPEEHTAASQSKQGAPSPQPPSCKAWAGAAVPALPRPLLPHRGNGQGWAGGKVPANTKGKENRENFVLNVFITSYSRVRCWLFSVLNEVLFLDFQIHTGKLFSSVSAFILYIYKKKYKQQTSKKTLILIAHLLHCFCVIYFILSFPYSKKKVPLLLPRLGSCYWRGSRRELLTVCTCCLTAWFRVTGKCWWVKKRLSRQPTHLLVIFLQRRVWQRRVVLFQIRWVQSKCPTDTMLWLILRTGIQSLHYATATNANGSQAAYSLHTALKSNNLRRRVLRQEKWELFINSFVNPSVYEVGIAFHPVPSHDILVSPRTRNGKAGWSFFHVLQLFGAKQLYVAEFQAAFMEGTKLDMHVLSPLLHVQNECLWRKNAISRQPSECILRKLPW